MGFLTSLTLMIVQAVHKRFLILRMPAVIIPLPGIAHTERDPKSFGLPFLLWGVLLSVYCR